MRQTDPRRLEMEAPLEVGWGGAEVLGSPDMMLKALRSWLKALRSWVWPTFQSWKWQENKQTGLGAL